jgi:thioredoxin 1
MSLRMTSAFASVARARWIAMLAVLSVLMIVPAAPGSAAPLDTTSDDTFDTDVGMATSPVLVAFTAPWCRACRVQEPTLGQIADNRTNGVIVLALDVDDNPLTPARFGVSTLPTLMLFRNGQPVGRLVGAQTRQQIVDWLAHPTGGPVQRSTPLMVTDARFRADVLESPTPTLLVFEAGWCMPCRQMVPDLEKLASDAGGALSVGRLDVDANPHVPGALSISKLPSAILIQDGRLVAQLDGRKSEAELLSALSAYVDGLPTP